ncbi:MAG: SGNH/GDSL hydrolase family protein [Clostridia bacterium]|nr:SGNH/GDSL hydrolase family protein [Clostridia bacterium]
MTLSNISVFGDSIGKGIITNGNQKSFAEKSAVKLFEEKFKTKINNFSKFGQTLAKTFKRGIIEGYIDKIPDKKDATVVIELGSNDCSYFWEGVASAPEKAHDPITPLKDFVSYYEKTLYNLKKSGVGVVCCNLVPINSKNYFDNVIGKVCDKNRVLEYFRGDYTTIYRHHEMFSNAIGEACRKYEVPLIDLRKPFLDSLEFSSYLCDDGIHPNERGQKLIFDSVFEFAKRYA